VVGSYKCDTKPSGFIKCQVFLDWHLIKPEGSQEGQCPGELVNNLWP